jgi:hypothetical protein
MARPGSLAKREVWASQGKLVAQVLRVIAAALEIRVVRLALAAMQGLPVAMVVREQPGGKALQALPVSRAARAKRASMEESRPF